MTKQALIFLMILLFLAHGAMAANRHYVHDDGTSELSLGGHLGDMVVLQYFDPQGSSETISHVSTAFGSLADPTGVMPSSQAISVYIWDDPDNDGDPTDAVLLGSGSGFLRHLDTDHFTHYPLDEPVLVTSRFFVGVKISTDSECWPFAQDTSQLSNGRAWWAVDNDNFDPTDLTNNDIPPLEMDTTLVPGIWLLRAHHLSPDVDGQSFDFTSDDTDVPGWTEQLGDWTITGRRLVSEFAASNMVITRDTLPLADGCVEVQGYYGDGIGLRYVGAVIRYRSDYDRIKIKLQDNNDSGYFDSCVVYDDTSSAFTATGQNYGIEPTLQVEFIGTQLHVRIDVDNDGAWEHDYPVTVTTTQSGAVGASAFNQVAFDNWYSGPSPDAWGGTVIDFDSVPEDYWFAVGDQNLGDHYPGLYFGSHITIGEATVYGYNELSYPWHSFDAVAGSSTTTELRVDFDEPKTHVGFWYTSADGDGLALAYDEGGLLLDSDVLLSNHASNGYISLDAIGIRYLIIRAGESGSTTFDDLEYQPANSPVNTVDASFDCSPTSGVLPFQVSMNIELTNAHETENRRLAARINVRLANNTSYSNWRNGYTNLRPLSSYTTSWIQNLPALGALVGTNNFTLAAEDVTPAPYNQPPYAPSGDAVVRNCLITASVP